MSTHLRAGDEPPHPKMLLIAVRDPLSPELRALLERICEKLEQHDVDLTRIQELLDDYRIQN